MQNFFVNLYSVLPCTTCKVNFKNHLAQNPMSDDVLSSRFDLVNWLINMHNQVNIQNNKPVVTYEQFIQKYLYTQQNDCLIGNNRATVICVSVILILVLIFVMKCKFNH
jgi:hypothetical protein